MVDNVPTVAKLIRAELNLEAWDEVVNGPEDEIVTTPGGREIKTLAGAMAALSALNDRGAWAQDTFYAARDIVFDSEVPGVYYVRTSSGNSPAGGTFQDEYDGGDGPWRVWTENSVFALSDQAYASPLFDLYNNPEKYRTAAAAIAAGACKVVFVGDSLVWGADTNAANSMPQRVKRYLEMMFPSCVFTCVNRGIPGAYVQQFNNAAFSPADSPFLSGPDVLQPDNTNDFSIRWPDGVDTHAGTSWKAVILADAPDLLFFGFTYNDIAVGGDSIKQWTPRMQAALGTIAGWTKVPSLVLMTEHDARLDPAWLSPANSQMVRGYARLIRGFSRYFNAGLLDMGRAYDILRRGTDPLKVVTTVERWFAGWPSAAQWFYQASANAATADTITVPGTAPAVLDSTGKHAGPGDHVYARLVECVGSTFRFNLRKLATVNDICYVWLGMDPVNPITGATAVPDGNKRQLRLFFYNDGLGAATVGIFQDGALVATVATLPPIPTDDSADYFITVDHTDDLIRVWVKNDNLNGTPRVSLGPLTHGPGYIGIGYANAVAAPAVKIKDFEMRCHQAYPVASAGGISDNLIYGHSAWIGGSDPYETEAQPVSGDGVVHFSDKGYALAFDSAIWAVMAGVRQAANRFAAIAAPNVQTGVAYTLVPADEGRMLYMSNAAAILLQLPTPAQATLYPGFKCRVMQLGAGQVVIAAGAGDTISDDSGQTFKVTPRQYAVLQIELAGINSAHYSWIVTGVERVPPAPNIQAGVAYTAALADRDALIYMSNAAANVVTLPRQSAVPLSVGFALDVMQGGAGQTSVAITAGDLIISDSGSTTLAGQYSVSRLKLVAVAGGNNTWSMSNGTGGPAAAPNIQTGTAYTVVAADRGRQIYMSNAAANVLTLPTPAQATLPLGFSFEVQQGGAGTTSVAAGSGDVLVSDSGLFSLKAQYSVAHVKLIGLNSGHYSWTMYHGNAGELAPNLQTGNTYTPTSNDRNRLIDCANAAAIAVTLPLQSAVPYPVGTRLRIRQGGAGRVTINAGAGDTLTTTTGSKILVGTGAIAYIELKSVAAGVCAWVADGDFDFPLQRSISQATLSADFTVTANGYRIVPFNTLTNKRGVAADWTLDGSGGMVAARDMGMCLITAGVLWNNPVSIGVKREMIIVKVRGAAFPILGGNTSPDSTAQPSYCSAVKMTDILAGDIIYVDVYTTDATNVHKVTNSSAPTTVNTGTELSIAQI